MKYCLGEWQVDDQGACFVANNATVVGRVRLEKDTSIWFNVVVRGDADNIIIGEGSNVQDGAVLHTDSGFELTLGKQVTVGHKAVLHGCRVGDGTLIGINAVVLNGAQIGRGCLIGANALVPENMVVPDGSLVVGSPAKIKRTLSDEQQQGLRLQAQHYVNNGHRFASELKEQADD